MHGANTALLVCTRPTYGDTAVIYVNIAAIYGDAEGCLVPQNDGARAKKFSALSKYWSKAQILTALAEIPSQVDMLASGELPKVRIGLYARYDGPYTRVISAHTRVVSAYTRALSAYTRAIPAYARAMRCPVTPYAQRAVQYRRIVWWLRILT
eukprot:3817341-Rhodomonas_salina.3